MLVIGAGEGCEFAAWLLQRREFQRIYTIVGIVDDDPAKQGMRYDGVSVLGSTADIPELVKRHDIGVIFYTIARIAPEDNRRILDVCKKTDLHVIMLSEVLDLLHHKLTEAVSKDEQVISETLAVREELEHVNV